MTSIDPENRLKTEGMGYPGQSLIAFGKARKTDLLATLVAVYLFEYAPHHALCPRRLDVVMTCYLSV